MDVCHVTLCFLMGLCHMAYFLIMGMFCECKCAQYAHKMPHLKIYPHANA